MSSNLWDATEQKLVQVSGNVNINDSVISEDSTFSSKKINDSLVDLDTKVDGKADKDNIVAETKSFTLNAKYGTPTQWTCNVAKSGYKVIGVTFEHGYSAQIVMAVETWGNDVLKGYAQLALSASEINITAYAHIIYQKI